MILDNEINFAHSLVKILILKKFDVSQTSNGLKAIETVKNKSLIIEYDKSFENSFRRNLKKLNYKYQIAYNVNQAIDLMKENNFSNIYFYKKLPDLNGAIILLKLKVINNDIKVVIITGYRDENGILNQIQRASDNSASFCLLKPFEFSHVVDLITQFDKSKMRWKSN